MKDIQLALEQKLIKQMNFGVTSIGESSCVFQDDCFKIPYFSTKPFDRGDEIKAQRAAFPN